MRTKLKLKNSLLDWWAFSEKEENNGHVNRSICNQLSQPKSSLNIKLLPLNMNNIVISCLLVFLLISNGISSVHSAPSPIHKALSSLLGSSTPTSSSKLSSTWQCGITQFSCGDASCIPSLWKCDGHRDCKDGSDEVGCRKDKDCEKNEFKCAINGLCIPNYWRCDDEDDCGDKSDEENCTISCSADQFTCKTGNKCLTHDLKCNGINDCADGSDELDCKLECTDKEFKCASGQCIDKTFVCDQEFDCLDSSDEKDCPVTTCASNQFTCNDGKCIPDVYRCDGNMDCKDESDELNCPKSAEKAHHNATCKEKSFRCEDGSDCIHIEWKCDGFKDCEDGSDEHNCVYNTTCRSDQFKCNSTGHCIPSYMRCNGAHECNDHSDEVGCETFLPRTCGPDMFQCKSTNKCISKKKLCDQDNDCGDWSDEPSTCNINECKTDQNHCSHECIDDLIGFHCECPRGLRLGNDSWTCHDIDECTEIFGICSNQKCINKKGHFKCECFEGYQLVDHRFCRVKTREQPLLIFANRHDIRQAHLPANRSGPRHYTSLYRALSSAVAIDYNLRENYLIWSDVAEEEILIGKLKLDEESKYAKENATTLISTSTTSKSVHGLAVDWIHDLLYWTDDVANTIEVAQIQNPLNRKVIIESGLDEPRAIAIDVLESMIVWADWGDQAFIERASQDGTNRKKLVDTNILWPNALTLDIVTKKIYWLDVKYHTLSSINYDGSGRITLYESPSAIVQPFAVDVFEDYLYYSDWKLDAIQRININDEPRQADIFLKRLDESPMGVKTVHSSKQPLTKNKCASTKCSHFCLPTEKSYQCVCRTGFELSHDGFTCSLSSPNLTSSAAIKTSSSSTSAASRTKTTKISAISSSTTISSSSVSPTQSSMNLPVISSSISPLNRWPSSSSNEKSDLLENESKGKSKETNRISDSFNFSDNANVVLNPSESGYSETDAHLVFIIIAICLTIALFITLLTFIIHRNYAKRNITSMNFDNPVYRKTTEEQFVLEKSEDSVNYPSSLEPLNSPGTNEFV